MEKEAAQLAAVRHLRPTVDGIEVQEAQLTHVSAQRLFKMRCECGRSWFELQLPQLVHCPACKQLGAVRL